jgi:hypothetical protein
MGQEPQEDRPGQDEPAVAFQAVVGEIGHLGGDERRG